jgi:hypothetical protein
MDTKNQEQAIDSLCEWSKWLIGLNVVAATGCIVKIEQVTPGNLNPFLAGAVLLFVLSNLVAVLLVGLHAVIVEALPLQDESGAPQSIYAYRVWQGVSLGRLAQLQFGLLVLGLASLVVWVTRPQLATIAVAVVLLGLASYWWLRQ